MPNRLARKLQGSKEVLFGGLLINKHLNISLNKVVLVDEQLGPIVGVVDATVKISFGDGIIIDANTDCFPGQCNLASPGMPSCRIATCCFGES